MIKKIINLLKKIVFSFLLLYGLNLLINSFNVVIPMNIFTLSVVTFLGVPGLASLVAMFFIVR